MEYKNLGRTGVKVSQLCLRCMNFGGRTDEAESIAIIEAALAAGINFIDTANVYGHDLADALPGLAIQLTTENQEQIDWVAPPGRAVVSYYGYDGFAWVAWRPHQFWW